MNKEIISIVVLSYNSNKTIIETLDSILIQDYGSQFIELIIGDDASTDNTQNLIKTWIKRNTSRFFQIKLNLNTKNKGIVSNFNSTSNMVSSTWLKIIAADDLLTHDCLSEFYDFVSKNNNVSCVFCKVEKFTETTSLGIIPKNNYYFKLDANKQFQSLLVDNFIPAPGSFIKTSLLRKVGFAEIEMIMEDYPLWLKITNMNIQLPLLDKTLVKYRIGNSISNSNSKLVNIKLNRDVYLCKKKYISNIHKKPILKSLLYFDILMFRFCDLFKIHILRNKRNRFSLLISPNLRFLSPLYIHRKIKK